MASRTTIRDLAFRHNTKPGLGIEILRPADLFARDRDGSLPESLALPQRPQFDMVLGLAGKGTMTIDFTPVPGTSWCSRRIACSSSCRRADSTHG